MTQASRGPQALGTTVFIWTTSQYPSGVVNEKWTKRKRPWDSRPTASRFSQLFGVLITQQQ